MRRLILFVIAGLLVVGCSGEKKTETKSTVMSNDHLAQSAAKKIIGEFSADLKGELMAAMKDGGAVNALEVCKVKAPEIAGMHAAGGVWTIARVSDKYRNPDDLATDEQMKILARFADTTGNTDGTFSEWKVDELGDSSYCYYQAIKTSALCLNCHGPADKLAPGVKEKLAELYPDDKAIDYAEGDLRGMFVVTMQWPAAKTAAEDLVIESESKVESH